MMHVLVLCISTYALLVYVSCFFFKQKTAYEMRISDWSSDVCSSDLALSEGVREIGWTGELLDEHYDEFVFRGTLDKSLPIEKVLYIPVVQECASGTESWIEIPDEEQKQDQPDGAAPGVMIMPAKPGH